MKQIKISLDLIRRIKVGDLADAVRRLSLAIYNVNNAAIFTGTKLHTAAAMAILVTAYVDAKALADDGGEAQKTPYDNARKAIVACLIDFGGYINELATDNIDVLHLSTLPTNETMIDYAALLREGAIAEGVTGVQGFRGQLLADCDPFGTGIEYFFILSEAEPLPDGVTISSTGQVKFPAAVTVTFHTNITLARKKAFVNLTPGVIYYGYYVLIYGTTIGRLGDEVQMSCGN